MVLECSCENWPCKGIQAISFATAFIDDPLLTARELEMNDWYTGNSGIVVLLSQEPCAMLQLNSNRLNHYWVLDYCWVLESIPNCKLGSTKPVQMLSTVKEHGVLLGYLRSFYCIMMVLIGLVAALVSCHFIGTYFYIDSDSAWTYLSTIQNSTLDLLYPNTHPLYLVHFSAWEGTGIMWVVKTFLSIIGP